MKKVRLTKGFVALVDNHDYWLVARYKWQTSGPKKNGTPYARTSLPRLPNGFRPTISMHRMILGCPTKRVDHENGNGIDNRRRNLRLATNGQNQANRRIITPHSSRFKGVRWDKRVGMWRARIGHDGKKIELGYFEDEVAAARAYNKRAVKKFGRFAALNHVKGRKA